MGLQRVEHHLAAKQQQYVRVSLEHAVWGKKDEDKVKESVRKIDFSWWAVLDMGIYGNY